MPKFTIQYIAVALKFTMLIVPATLCTLYSMILCPYLHGHPFTSSVLTITAAQESAIQIFSECLPKIGEVRTTYWIVLLIFQTKGSIVKEPMSRGYCHFKSILSQFKSLLSTFTHTQNVLVALWTRYETYFVREH